VQHWLSTRAGRYVFAVLVTVLGLVASVVIGTVTGGGAALLIPFFPAVVAVTLYAGAGPAIGCGLLALAAWTMGWSRSVVHLYLTSSDLWTLGVFTAAAAVSIGVCARARRAAVEHKRRAEHEASRTSTLSDEFLSKLSHELRTPLSAIIGWTQVLRAQTPPEPVAHGLEVIERNARAQTRIIEDLIDANQANAGNGTLHAAETADPPPEHIAGGKPLGRVSD